MRSTARVGAVSVTDKEGRVIQPARWTRLLLPPDPGTLRRMLNDHLNLQAVLILFALSGLLAIMAKEIA